MDGFGEGVPIACVCSATVIVVEVPITYSRPIWDDGRSSPENFAGVAQGSKPALGCFRPVHQGIVRRCVRDIEI